MPLEFDPDFVSELFELVLLASRGYKFHEPKIIDSKTDAKTKHLCDRYSELPFLQAYFNTGLLESEQTIDQQMKKYLSRHYPNPAEKEVVRMANEIPHACFEDDEGRRMAVKISDAVQAGYVSFYNLPLALEAALQLNTWGLMSQAQWNKLLERAYELLTSDLGAACSSIKSNRDRWHHDRLKERDIPKDIKDLAARVLEKGRSEVGSRIADNVDPLAPTAAKQLADAIARERGVVDYGEPMLAVAPEFVADCVYASDPKSIQALNQAISSAGVYLHHNLDPVQDFIEKDIAWMTEVSCLLKRRVDSKMQQVQIDRLREALERRELEITEPEYLYG